MKEKSKKQQKKINKIINIKVGLGEKEDKIITTKDER